MRPERNDPCPCGSGKKYKKCCSAKDEAAHSASLAARAAPAVTGAAAEPHAQPAGSAKVASPKAAEGVARRKGATPKSPTKIRRRAV